MSSYLLNYTAEFSKYFKLISYSGVRFFEESCSFEILFNFSLNYFFENVIILPVDSDIIWCHCLLPWFVSGATSRFILRWGSLPAGWKCLCVKLSIISFFVTKVRKSIDISKPFLLKCIDFLLRNVNTF